MASYSSAVWKSLQMMLLEHEGWRVMGMENVLTAVSNLESSQAFHIQFQCTLAVIISNQKLEE